jgi:hypothetical protein
MFDPGGVLHAALREGSVVPHSPLACIPEAERRGHWGI